ncbi:MAG: hypothetical protein C0501_28900 [Isosphaera sp.]|nr:hypothetical protein [Isosphaera sp.]
MEPFLLSLTGPPGGKKSSWTRLLARLLDPHHPQAIQLPYDRKDALLDARGRWVVGYDEVDEVTRDKPRLLAVLATGAGTAARQLWTDGETFTFELTRPVVINGHGDLTAEPRVLDRALPVVLPRVGFERDEGLTKAEVDARFAEIHAGALGALCDLAVKALARQGRAIPPGEGVRMLGAAEWAEKILQAAGFEPGTFVRTLRAAQAAAGAETAAGWPALPALEAVARDGFEGTPTAVLQRLTAAAGAVAKVPGFPTAPQQLTRQLNQHAAAIAALGIQVIQGRRERGAVHGPDGRPRRPRPGGPGTVRGGRRAAGGRLREGPGRPARPAVGGGHGGRRLPARGGRRAGGRPRAGARAGADPGGHGRGRTAVPR